MRALIRQPLLHFLALGGLLFVLSERWAPPDDEFDAAPIVVTREDVARLRSAWRADSGREPGETELRASIERHVDEERLLREALRLELDARDPVARERLLLNLRFLFPDRRASEETLLREARALGMARSDPVVRRRLIQAMERRLSGGIDYDESALRAYVERNAARYGREARYGFRHVFFAADGADAHARVAQALARLVAGADASTLQGDAFLLGERFTASTRDDVARRFGVEFAEAVAAADPGAWIGPLSSPYGLHLLQVEQRIEARPPDFAAVHGRALQAWRREREAERLREALAGLRARYPAEERTS